MPAAPATPPSRGRRRRGLDGWRPAPAGAALLLAAALAAAGFTLDRPRHFDLSGLSWSAALPRLCALLEREYPFTAWKGIDWQAVAGDLAPRVARAEAEHDRRAWYLAIRELVWRMRDGHAHLVGDDGGLRRAATSGSYGFQVAELDDGRLLVSSVAAGGAADRAGLRFGAELVRWRGLPAAEALARVPVLWSDRPPATREGLRLEQARWLGRAPAGEPADVAFRNRGAAEVESRTLIATQLGPGVPGSSGATGTTGAAGAGSGTAGSSGAPAGFDDRPDGPPCLGPTTLVTDRTVETRVLPEGVGYVRLRFELPALRTPVPGWLLRRALRRFESRGLPGLVLDVRGNCGGVDAMVPPLVAPFLREAELYEIPGVLRRDRGRFEPDPRQAIAVLPEPPLYRGRIAVLVDGDTLSAGEAIPLLLKGLPGVAVIGWHATQGSFGIGEKSVSLPAGLEIVFPHAQSLDADGVVEVDGDAAGRGGVEPDQRLPLTEAAFDRRFGHGEDMALAAAIRFARGERAPDAPAARGAAAPPPR